jgi:hypothetical protein
MVKISAIVNYCSNDERFIRKSLDNLLTVTDDIVVPISDHFFDGAPEDLDSISNLVSDYPNVNFKLYNWIDSKFPRYWHNFSRYLGTQFAKNDWILYLDSDEIIDSKLFKEFLNSELFSSSKIEILSYKLACYWYFREPIYQADKWEDSPVFVKKDLIKINLYDASLEREQMHEILNVPKTRMVTVDGLPLVHHYSWVRSKEEMIKKVKTWGHSKDKNWVNLVEEEFSRPFNGTDFIHGYKYKIVDNKFNL